MRRETEAVTPVTRAFVVAGTASGTGKTTVAMGLMAALRGRGLVVQPFKCGPDFIDPGHHTQICGRPSRNLDTWMLPAESNRQIFYSYSRGTDVSVVEGVMGLFDGASCTGEGSTAATARLLNLPVCLVVDASGMGASVAALIRGFAGFDPTVSIAGVIFNRVAGAAHYRLLSDACTDTSSIVPLGYIPRDNRLRIPKRHLGLVTADEGALSTEAIGHLAMLVDRYIEVDRLLELAVTFPRAPGVEAAPATSSPLARIGVARDRAFCFYYEDNLDALRAAGAELVTFSPLHDHDLPPRLDALYLGGGYPELCAQRLSENAGMRKAVAAFIDNCGTVYAECGGLMYLAARLRTRDGSSWPMIGAFPFTVSMTEQLQDFGYMNVNIARDCLLGRAGTVARGHSFHYSRIEEPLHALAPVYRLTHVRSRLEEPEGYTRGGVLASYVHLHFASNPELAKSFVKSARSRTTRR